MQRSIFINQIQRLFKTHPIVAILGPRQCGKTTLARQYAASLSQENITHFDLEDIADLIKLETLKFSLAEQSGLIILDEIQRKPEIFPQLRVFVDNPKIKQRFLILGSASRELLKQTSESLAGRIAYIELTPFQYKETLELNELWVRGGFPRSYLADTLEESWDWRTFYIRNFLENDIRHLGFDVSPNTMQRFWMMLTHYHGNLFNASELSRSLSFSHTTARRYLDILIGTFMIRELTPWLTNIKKRQLKTPKIYFRDSGVLNYLLGLTDLKSLKNHPKLGAAWEGFALEEIIRIHQARPEECFYWGIHQEGELDLIIQQPGKLLGFEVKFSDAPRLTSAMKNALQLLNLDKLTVIFPGKNNSYKLNEKIEAIALEDYLINA